MNILKEQENLLAAKLDALLSQTREQDDRDYGLELFCTQRALAKIMMQDAKKAQDAHYHFTEAQKTLDTMKHIGTVDEEEYNTLKGGPKKGYQTTLEVQQVA